MGGSMKRRCHCLTAFTVAASIIICLHGSDAFTTPSSNNNRILPRPHQKIYSHKNIHDENDSIDQQQQHTVDTTQFTTRPLITAATSVFLATSLLFSNPLLPPPNAAAQAITSQASTQSQTATQIEIDLASVPALTRKAFVNRDKLTNYLIESFKSFKPILNLLSDSDTVVVTPPKDIKGAVNQVLTKGDAQFVVNGESVDVRVESVPGVVIVRVINPNIPRLPFLRDGSASLQFVNDIVDVAPQEFEKAAEEVQAVEKFLMWGAPEKAPLTYKGSSFEYWLSSKFTYNGGKNTLSLGSSNDLTNSQVVLLGVGTGVFTAYATSYSYYMSVQEEQERKEAEKKEAKKKKKMAVKKKKTAPPVKEANVKKSAEVKEEKEGKIVETKEDKQPIEVAKSAPKKQKDDTTKKEETKKKGRKRDVIKNIFQRGGKKQ